MPAVNASEKAKEKAELGARFGSKLGLSLGTKKDANLICRAINKK